MGPEAAIVCATFLSQALKVRGIEVASEPHFNLKEKCCEQLCDPAGVKWCWTPSRCKVIAICLAELSQSHPDKEDGPSRAK